ncbi:type VII secretion target [Mycolicibacter hiberniae]|uniref:Uncharacterized protein n=1 Tax=Mycolicibacter hiberniae TaxID=29314 RepID=A0A7I7X4V7_9MYCO|nr:type VII secretion target [Mycolicibacter hiberniae]MCV7086138.1 hypothetical protein [Mycolicibacter hiberniae]ORV70690.1 hypothetical protein AWC09_09655 [Mycolicibacter hiberniae]BBZ24255.1 hypothetical protein MHIB_26730 [Mycolicibacter hiberniae]
MGQLKLYLDAAALCSVADHFDTTAAAMDTATRIRLGGLTFGGATAGRDCFGAGEELRRALHGWVPELIRWSRAATEIAAALRAASARYRQVEVLAAERVG